MAWKMAWCASPVVTGGKGRVASGLLSLQSMGISSAEAAFWRRVFTRSSALASGVVWTVSPFFRGGIGKDPSVLFHLIARKTSWLSVKLSSCMHQYCRFAWRTVQRKFRFAASISSGGLSGSFKILRSDVTDSWQSMFHHLWPDGRVCALFVEASMALVVAWMIAVAYLSKASDGRLG